MKVRLRIILGTIAIIFGISCWDMLTSGVWRIILILIVLSGAIIIASAPKLTTKNALICPNCEFKFDRSLYVVSHKSEDRIACPNCGTIIKL